MARRLHPFALAFAAGTLVSLAYLVAHLGPGVVGLSVPTSPLLALLLFAAKPLLDLLSRRTAGLGARGPLATSLALALVAPWITLAALHALGEPVAYSGYGRCGTPRTLDEMAAPVAFFLAGALGMLVGLALVRRQGLVDRVAPALGGALAALALVALAASLARTSHRPDPEGYVASLPFVARERAADPHDLVGTPSERAHSPLAQYETDLGGPLLSRLCDGEGCLVVLRSPSVPSLDLDSPSWNAAHQRLANVDAADDDTLVVRRDRDHDVWILETHWGGSSTYRGPTFRRSDLLVSDVSSALRPPGGWMAGTAGGLLLAGLIFALRRRALRAAADLCAGRPGTLGESGMVTFAGGEPPVRAAPAQPLAVGPVVVLPGPVTQGGVYRGDASLQGARVVVGAKDELYAAAKDRASALGALLPAVVLLGAAPIVAAALVGIVF